MTPGVDRYRASNLHAYNEKLVERYDSAIALRVLRPSIMDDFVLSVTSDGIESKAVLDVGCATGRLLERLAEAGARILAGTDVAPRILETARRRLARLRADVDLRTADAEESLPWPDSTFDVVASTGVIHHFRSPEKAISEFGRVLRRGGRLVLVDACFFPPLRELLNLCLRIHPHEGDHRFLTDKHVKALLEARGWNVDRCERLSWWAFGVAAVR